MKRDIRDFLEDILAYSAKAREVVARKPQHIDQLSDEGMVLILCLQIIGEAVKHIPEKIREQYPETPWNRIAGMRDKLVHDYWGTDMPIVLKAASVRLPELEVVVKKILNDINDTAE